MHRSITAAVFAVILATAILLRAHLPGLFVEPTLLALIGAFFLIAARLTSAEEKAKHAPGLREAESRS